MAIYRGTGGSGDSTQDTTISEVTTQAVNAASSATEAATSASSASTSAANASASEAASATSATSASASATTATTKATEAAASAASALSSKNASAASASAAATSETNAGISETNAATSATASASSAANALSSKNAAATSETNASNSATASATSATTATTQASTATTKASEALASQTASAASETSAATSATTATTQASIATTKASEASASAAAAASSESASATSETNAASSASASASSASASSSSASDAQSSEDDAATSATTATTQAGIATTQASNAATSATAAASSATAASASETAAATSLATFTGQYTSSATAPSSPDVGDLWFDESVDIMKVYGASGWANAGSSVNGVENSVQYIATAGQTTFAATYDAGYVDVYLNGILLATTDYTATNGTSVVLDVGASVSDVVYIQAFGTFALADHYNKVDSDARYAQESYVDTEIAALVASSPATLDTLNELAAALGDDPNFATTVTNSIATKLPLSGGTLTGDVSHGDNVKAKFGSSDDLQVYHDGSNSYISELGTGDLVLQSNGAKIGLASASPFEWMVEAVTDGEVKLYHNGAAKLATTSTGVDVTGTVTADGFHIASGSGVLLSRGSGADTAILSTGWTGGVGDWLKLEVPSGDNESGLLQLNSNGNVGIGTSSPASIGGHTGVLTLYGPNATALVLKDAVGQKDIRLDDGNLKITDSVGAPHLIVDSSGNVGIGTGNPAYQLEVGDGSDASETINLKSSNTGSTNIFFSDAASNGQGRLTYTHSDNALKIYTADAERMRIDSSGDITTTGNLSIDGFSSGKDISFRTGYGSDNVGIRAKAITTANRDGLEILGYNGIDLTVNNGANVAVHVNAAGIVTTPNQPAFSLGQDSKASADVYVDVVTSYNHTLLNVGNHASTTTGKFTAPVAGSYMFTLDGTHKQADTGDWHTMVFYKNGAYTHGSAGTYSGGQQTSDASNVNDDLQFSKTIVIHMDVNDYMQVLNLSWDGIHEYIVQFSGHLIG